MFGAVSASAGGAGPFGYKAAMDNLDLRVLHDVLAWKRAGHDVTLVTFLETWGNSPRPPGALFALRDDGTFSGSGSGGYAVDDIVLRTRAALELAPRGKLPLEVSHSISSEEAARSGLTCGGSLRLVQEPVNDVAWIADLLERVAAHRSVKRTLTLASGEVLLADTTPSAAGKARYGFDGLRLSNEFGPNWRLVVIGAGELGQAVAGIARQIDFEVLICDPREAFAHVAGAGGSTRVPGMPDAAVRALRPDAHTAVVALTHEPELDDLGLYEALKTDAFYIGALGSKRNQEMRRKRLAERFGLVDEQLNRLFGPAGLKLGAKTPAEIGLSIVAELLKAKNGLAQPVVVDAAAPALAAA